MLPNSPVTGSPRLIIMMTLAAMMPMLAKETMDSTRATSAAR